jgi:transcriptional regulator with GAF, ATPase, and Fis domain
VEFHALLASGPNLEPEFVALAHLAHARHHLTRGNPEGARESAESALAAAEANSPPSLPASAKGLLASALDALGRSEDAAVVREQGRALVKAAAERIADPALRADFLARPEFLDLKEQAEVPSTDDRKRDALYEMIRVVNSESDADALLDAILDMALREVRAERGMILLRDPGKDTFSVCAARNAEDETEKDARSFSTSIVAQAGAGRAILTLDAGHDERFRDLKSVSLFGIRSLMCVPLRSRGRIIGTVYLDTRREGAFFSQDDLRFLEAFADHAAIALENQRRMADLERENRRLQVEAEERAQIGNLVGRSPAMQRVFDLVEKMAASDLPVLILGESGTGKELVARAIHALSPLRRKPFLSENCAAIPESLQESELFGVVRGAYTGADRDRPGLFEQADGGTLFLDEIGDISPGMQVRLLRVLQEGELRRVGGEKALKVKVRFLAATNKDLAAEVASGRFRQDLLYRLQVLMIQMPALRERPGDIPLLVRHLLERISRGRGRPAPALDSQVLALFERYPWPGNVRELENAIQRLALLAGDRVIDRALVESEPDLRSRLLAAPGKDDAPFRLKRSEREIIHRALEEVDGNRDRAAKLLGISRATIYRKIKEFGLS